jgi:2-methylcitrate dehydratase PrpD
MNKTIAQRLGARVAAADFETFSSEVVAAAKISLIDTIGVTIAGATHPLARTIADHALATRGGGKAHLAARPDRGGSLLAAALANAATAHVLDYDDTIYEGLAHASAPIVPALLAIADHEKISGKQLIVALIVGLETVAALARGFSDALYHRGVWTTACLGMIGSAAASASALRLDRATATHAIALAAAQALGTREVMGTGSKPYLCGVASSVGLDAALAARAGVTAPPEVFEGRSGIILLLNAGAFDATALDAWGSAIARPIIGFKLFPVCSAAQAAAEATQAMMREHRVTADDVERVECAVTPFVDRCLPYDAPRNASEAQFSIHFAVACVLRHSEIRPEHLDVAHVNDATLRRLMTRVSMTVDPGLVPSADESRHLEAAAVTITRRDGAQHRLACLSAICMPPNRPNDRLVREKFAALARPWLGAATDRLLNFVNRIEVEPDAAAITANAFTRSSLASRPRTD